MKGIIIVFRLQSKTDQKILNKFCQRFYGQDTSSWKGKYRYHRQGLLDEIPHRKLIRGVIILLPRHEKTVKRFLRQYSAEVHVRTMILTVKDCKILGVPLK